MGKVCLCSRSLPSLPFMGQELVGTVGRSFHLRCVHHEEDPLAVVEGYRRAGPFRDGMGGCTGVRTGGGLLYQSLLLPELRHSVFIA